MMRSRKLENEISVSELLEMRKTMSVADMAKALDVSRNTIYRYIGKKRAEKIASGSIQTQAPSDEAKESLQEKMPTVRPVLKILNERIVRELQGSVCVFQIDSLSNTVEMKDDGASTVTGLLSIEDIPLFVEELKLVYKSLKKGA